MHKLDAFRARGEGVDYEDEAFTIDDWQQLFIGHGVLPETCDPAVDRTPPELLQNEFARLRGFIRQKVEEQRSHSDYLREVCRVSRKVMFTTPNKDFPVEVHTFVPLAHWLPDPQFRAILRRLGHHDLARIEQLNPLDAETFVSLFPADRDTHLVASGLPLLRTNLICVSVAQVGR